MSRATYVAEQFFHSNMSLKSNWLASVLSDIPEKIQRFGGHISVFVNLSVQNDGAVTGLSISKALIYIPRHSVCLSAFMMRKAV